MAGATLRPVVAAAQTERSVLGAAGGLVVGGELEGYVRALQLTGQAPLGSWSLRPFSPAEVDSLTRVSGEHPWRSTWLFSRAGTARHLTLLPARAAVRFNSAYPFGGNDGAVWAGRGATTSLEGGVAAAAGPFSMVLDPILFRAENRPFTLQPNGETGSLRFGDGEFAVAVDRPQRFGDGPYARLDGGESTIRLDGFGISAGFTTASQWWGPAVVFPVIVGNNAPGIPRAFLGTERPANVGIGRFQARVEYGIERQSSYSAVTGSRTFVSAAEPGTLRFMSGLIATFSPAPLPGLDLGLARYFHQAWTGRVGSAELASPFEGILKTEIRPGYAIPGLDNQDVLKNQLASVFARWVLPHSGFELYTEYGHEDHNYDARDLFEEPDHSRIAMAGLRKAFRQGGDRLSVLNLEFIDASLPSLARHRGEGGIYVHVPLRQGHTEGGQIIGADAGVGSFSGAVVSWDAYSHSGRTTFFLRRTVQNPILSFAESGIPFTGADHLAGTAGIDRYRIGSTVDLRYGVALTDAKRGIQLRPELNVSATVAATAHF